MKEAPAKILKRAFDRQLRKNPSYSLRSAARAIKVSPAFLSGLLNGKKKIPLDRLASLARALDMDESSQKLLRRAILLDMLGRQKGAEALVEEYLEDQTRVQRSEIASHSEGTLREFSVLAPWHRMAILDLVTCHGFNPDPQWIAARLDIRPSDAQSSLDQLVKAGFVECHEGQWKKTIKKIRFPTTRSHPAIRDYHQVMIEKALRILVSEVDDASFDRRLITAVSFAANPKNMKKARECLMEALYEISGLLTEGECTEVYQLNAQLYPLTKR